MINLKKSCIIAAISLALTPSTVFAGSINDVVVDYNRNIVKNTFNNCVVSKWDAASDACSGKQEVVVDKISREMLNVYFDFNRSTLNSRERSKLNTVSRLIKESKEVQAIDIAGYADSIGNNGYNRSLSAKRAKTVKNYLARKGLKTRKLTVEAFGESRPVTNCDAKALSKKDLISCLAEDRRVEIRLVRTN